MILVVRNFRCQPKKKNLLEMKSFLVKYSEKATKHVSHLSLLMSKKKWKMGQIFVAFSEYLNFKWIEFIRISEKL